MYHRLPPEIFDDVITAFTVWPTFNPALGVRMTKREIGQCSLVCRHWARRCRYWLFASVIVHSRADFDSLLRLIDAAVEIDGIPSLVECIQEIEIKHRGAWEVPWFHQILQHLQARDMDIEKENIVLEICDAYVPDSDSDSSSTQPDVKSHYAPRSLSTSLPRTVPRSLFSHEVLRLSDLRFRTVRDLLRLIHDQADLTFIFWKRISFDEGAVIPPPTVRSRRAWAGVETLTISEWSDIAFEMRVMFLLAAEKVKSDKVVSAKAWTAMSEVALALLLPSSRQIVLGMRGEALGVTYQIAELRESATHFVEFDIVEPTKRHPSPHIAAVRICVRASAEAGELQLLPWNALEDAVLSLSPIPAVELCVEHRPGTDGAEGIFKWLLDAVPTRSILERMSDRGILDVRFALTDRRTEWRFCEFVTMQEVLMYTQEYARDVSKPKLTAPQVFELMVHWKQGNRQLSFRKLLESL